MTTSPGDSSGPLAGEFRLNPITKLILLVSACIVALRLEEPRYALGFLGLVVLGHLMARVKPAILWRRTRGILIFSLILFASQILLVTNVVWEMRPLHIQRSRGGVC
jgi:energy-coupling factor transporter transmembrane protein EcfT